MSDFNLNALTALRAQLKTKVEMGPHLNDILEIAAGGFMTKSEAQSVRNDADSQMRRLIEILQGKGDKEFDIFCEMLRESNYSVWADKLKQEAKAKKEGEKCSIVAILFLYGSDRNYNPVLQRVYLLCNSTVVVDWLDN